MMGSSKSPLAKISDVQTASQLLSAFRSRGYADIDTARAYPVGHGGTCESLLGSDELRLGKWANVSTKVASFLPGSHKASNIARSINQSLAALKVDQLEALYLHAPDRSTPLLETCAAIDREYRDGKFLRFGVSNYPLKLLKEMVHICNLYNFVKPSVYQGQYNLLCRDLENGLLSYLHQNDISFHAYSPAAGGFLAKDLSRRDSLTSQSRWTSETILGAKYARDYLHGHLIETAREIQRVAASHGISGHAAALRWTVWHSALRAECGDGVILGVSSLSQIEEDMVILEQGPLPQALVREIDTVWTIIKNNHNRPHLSLI